MKKQVVFAAMMVLLGLVLSGCPEMVDPAGPIDNGGEDVQTGTVIIQGNIYDGGSDKSTESSSLKYYHSAKSNAEGKSLRDISLALLSSVERITLRFEANLGNPSDYSRTYYFGVDPEGGYEGRIDLPAGTYNVYANAESRTGATIYSYDSTTEVHRGVESYLTVVFELVLRFDFNWEVSDFPGLYPSNGDGYILVPIAGQPGYRQYWFSYYGPCCTGEPIQSSELHFYSNLPVNFSGDGGIIFIQDIDGNQWATDMPENFDIYTAVDGELFVPYEESSHTGTVLIDIVFDHDRYVFGVESNEYYEEIQGAVWGGSSNIQLGSGNYAGFYIGEYTGSISIIGQGPDATSIGGLAEDNPWTIHFEQPYWYSKGGASRSLSIADATVQAVGENDAVILFEYPEGVLKLDNVWVHSGGGDAIVVANNSWIQMDHCVVSTWNQSGNGVTILGQSPAESSIKSSIIVDTQSVLVCEVPVDFAYNCVHSFNQMVEYFGTPVWEPELDTLVLEDPLPFPISWWYLQSDSPCIGMADDGSNIGLRYTETLVCEWCN